MFSLQLLLGKGDRFHDLLEASAVECQQSVRLALDSLRAPASGAKLDDLVLARRKGKKLAGDIGAELTKTFVTGLEREDIEALSNALYKIPKSAEKFAERFLLAAPQLGGVSFARQADLMEKAIDTVVSLVKQLRHLQEMDKVRELNERLQFLEGEADKHMVDLYRDLCSGQHDALKVLILKDLYELMEKVIDRCRDAGNVVQHVVHTKIVSSQVLVCALLGAVAWNLITWWFGLPSSSSHALVGGLCGACLAAAGNRWSVIVWPVPAPTHWWLGKGLLWKVIVPMVTSPLCGLAIGFLLMVGLYLILREWAPSRVQKVFGRVQLASSATMGFMHGTNDAQKTMGIIALALLAATQSGTFKDLPGILGFLRVSPPPAGGTLEIAVWIKVVCAPTMASGTAAGGWRIIRTLGHKMVRLQPVHGFAAETTSAAVICAATQLGIPVSTTHNISAAIMGVGAARRFNALKWSVVERMVWAWILALPVTAVLSYLLLRLVAWCG